MNFLCPKCKYCKLCKGKDADCIHNFWGQVVLCENCCKK